MIRRFDRSPDPARRYSRRPGVYAVLLRDAEVLLTHQAEPWPEFQLPGGGIDPGEHPLTALHREVREETGWTIRVIRRLGAFRRFTFMPEYDLWAEKLCTIYMARPVVRRGAPTEPGHTAVWTDPATATRVLANDGDRYFLRRAALTPPDLSGGRGAGTRSEPGRRSPPEDRGGFVTVGQIPNS